MHVALSVGQRHPLVNPGHPQDQVLFITGPSGLEMRAIISQPGKDEARAWARGRLRLALMPYGLHTLFVLYELHGFGPWSDIPFTLGGMPPDCRTLVPRGHPGQGRLVFVNLIRAEDAIVEALRAVSVSPAFSSALEAALDAQTAALPKWTRAAYDAEIAAAYREFPEVADMVRRATIIETAGIASTFPGTSHA
jgi:hypothetical protein